MIRREDASALLRQCKPTLERDYGVTVLGLFGSIARDQAGEASDVDVVHYRDRMNAFLKQRIDQEAQYV